MESLTTLNTVVVEKKTVENIELIIYLILFGKSDFDIAKQLSISLSALHRLKNTDAFLDLYDKILKNIENNVIGKMVSVYSSALSKIQELINSGNESIALEASTKILKIRLGNFESNSNVQINMNNSAKESESQSSSLISDIIQKRKERKLD